MCSGDVPCLAHMEQGSGPLHPEHLPPSLSAWSNGDSVYLQPLRRMDLNSGVEIRSQPNTDPVIVDNVCDIIFIPSRKLFWSVYQKIVCLVLIAVIFLGWLTTTRNKRVLPCAYITFSWVGLHQCVLLLLKWLLTRCKYCI